VLEGSYVGAVLDTRTCRTCDKSCTVTGVGNCPTKPDGVLHFSENACDANDTPAYSLDGNDLATLTQCTPVNNSVLPSHAFWTPVPHSWGTTCSVDTSIKTGGVQEDDPWTVCCR
jgi:hypothetical protein